MNALVIRTRYRFIVRNNRKVAGEWHVYLPTALPCPVPFVGSEELDKMLDVMQKVATVQIDDLSCRILCGKLPEGVTGYDVARCVNELDG